MRHIKVILFTVFLSIVGFNRFNEVEAQCPMCRMSAESNLKNGGTSGKGLNKGILYLFFTPYLVIGTLGFLWWKNNKSKLDEENQTI
jgi:hypothetical protein